MHVRYGVHDKNVLQTFNVTVFAHFPVLYSTAQNIKANQENVIKKLLKILF